MGYVERVLLPGETIVARTHLHWIVYVRPATLTALSALCVAAAFSEPRAGDGLLSPAVWMIGAALAAVAALWSFVRAWIARWTTEIVLTSRRVIQKEGLIRRSTTEMNLEKVEGIDVEQSVMGRLLGYGAIYVKGTGSGIGRLRNIARPVHFRSKIFAECRYALAS